VELRRREYALLLYLAREPARVVAKAELLRQVWGYPSQDATRTVESHASRLRRKLARPARPDGCPRFGASATASRPEHNYQQEEGMENRTELIRLGEQLRRVREQKRLTVVDLAGRSNISPTRVAKLEAGLTDPRFDVLVALSDGLGVGLSALIPDDEEGQAS